MHASAQKIQLKVNNIPHQTHSVRSIALYVRRVVKQIRNAKFADGKKTEEIQAMFPGIEKDWVEDICWYRVWKTLETEQGIVSIIAEVFAIGSDRLLSLADQVGFRMSVTDRGHVVSFEETFRNLWSYETGWRDAHEVSTPRGRKQKKVRG